MNKKLYFCDLFAGLGGFREGFENGTKELGIETECTLTCEIKKSAITVYKDKYKNDNLKNENFINIRDLNENNLKDIKIDVLLGGFVCKSFSNAGKRKGFNCSVNGDLFFQILKILRIKKPKYFILENVDALVTHDNKINKYKINKTEFENENSNNLINSEIEIGETFKIILDELNKLDYTISWEVLNTKDFELPQKRKRIFIVGILNENKKEKFVNLKFKSKEKKFKEIMEKTTSKETEFSKLLNKYIGLNNITGKRVRDIRGDKNNYNIHSWDFNFKGEIDKIDKKILLLILENRRKNIFKIKYKITTTEFPLKYEDIIQLCIDELYLSKNESEIKIDNLIKLGYLKAKNKCGYDGYDLICSRLIFPFNNFINPESQTLTLTATDAQKIGVVENNTIRKLTYNEMCDLFGFNKNLVKSLNLVTENQVYDLFGNSLGVKIVEEITKRMLK